MCGLCYRILRFLFAIRERVTRELFWELDTEMRVSIIFFLNRAISSIAGVIHFGLSSLLKNQMLKQSHASTDVSNVHTKTVKLNTLEILTPTILVVLYA